MKTYKQNMIKRLQQRHRVVQIVSKIFIPLILLFAFYVQFHGDFGPGGGFQAGVIFASAFILHGLIFGEGRTRLVLPPYLLRFLMSFGLLLYAGTGVISLLLGGNYLDYSVLSHEPTHGQHWGIFTVELGVGITVSAVMVSLFYCFSSKRPGGVANVVVKKHSDELHPTESQLYEKDFENASTAESVNMQDKKGD